MPPPLIDGAVALPAHCQPSSPLLSTISSLFHVCIPTPLALISSMLGVLSIVSWLFAQLPQIYKNYQLQSAAGLSLFFLIEWCLGDTGNLLGALFTRQASWQVVIAAYYVLVDVVLVLQFFWYSPGCKKLRRAPGRRRHRHPHLPSEEDEDEEAEQLSSSHVGSATAVLEGVSPFLEADGRSAPRDVKSSSNASKKPPSGLFYDSMSSQSPSPSYSSNEKSRTPSRAIRRHGSGPVLPPSASPRVFLLVASMLCIVAAHATPTAEMVSSPSSAGQAPLIAVFSSLSLEMFGRVCSWLSTLMYLGSRPPQLYKNYRRRSTSGLSPLLFTAAFCGNLLYSLSLLTNPNAWNDFPAYGGGGWSDARGNKRADWIGRTAPFFLGAAGVLALDGLMGLQFLIYGSIDDDVGDGDVPIEREPLLLVTEGTHGHAYGSV